ncbi:pirin family protein [Ectothiorhodospiraceae bacterium WFHF3C12]|nr:pirin family protein [Ectothiorhodospiraceae bacterium WFHF3C12]
MKKIRATFGPPHGHWVGDGFPVRSLFSYDRMGARNVSPFLLLDYAGPIEFGPARRPRGVGQHPHRGFETVTLVYRGELEHRDSGGGGGHIGEGDVQWMTAGDGIVHEELHSEAFTASGGVLEMVQLWVNLPAEHKRAAPAYQTLRAADFPVVALDAHGSRLRRIAGEYADRRGPARTFTPVNVWDVGLVRDSDVFLAVPDGHTTLAVVLSGTVRINDAEVARHAELVCFEREGGEIRLEANGDARLLVLTGEPIEEPVVGRGPFVMNTESEIEEAIADYSRGTFGALEPA